MIAPSGHGPATEPPPGIGRPDRFDVVLAADMTRPGDIGLRIARECGVQAEMGLRSGLLHLPSAHKGGRLSADVQGCVRRGLAHVVDLQRPVRARLMVVHAPGVLSEFPPGLRNLAADRVVLVLGQPPEVATMGRWLGLMRGPVTWAPTNRWVRAAIEDLRLPIDLEPADWRPVALPPRAGPRLKPGTESGLRPGSAPRATAAVPAAQRRPTIGYVAASGRGQWPTTPEAVIRLLPIDGTFDVHLANAPPTSLFPTASLPPAWTVFKAGDIAVERFLAGIDVLVYFPSADAPELPDAAIATAMAAGKPVLTTPRFRHHFGPGLLYVEPDDALASIVRLLRDPEATARAGALAAAEAVCQFPAAAQRERVARLAGNPRPRRSPAGKRRRLPRAIMLPSNGVGLGHVTRLLAIARRAAGRFEPIFATMAQAVPVIESLGYHAEYIPSRSDTHADPGVWDDWLRVELARLIRGYDAEILVFDGNNPTPGLVRAALSQPPCALAWVRRGMGNATPSPYLDNARFFDLIVEPGELAAERDDGPTAGRRHEAVQVPPIRLLDEAELLPRDAAAAALNLDPARPAVLVQLGSGSHRDVVSLVDAVVKVLSRFEGVQIVIAEWQNAVAPLALWPGTAVLRGFPLSQYFRAFDFSIAAAGYNTFHETIAFGLPTVFVANTHAALDDQSGRAGFAHDAGAALELSEDELFQLPAVCEVMLDRRAQVAMRANCRALRCENGAASAAAAIASLVEPA